MTDVRARQTKAVGKHEQAYKAIRERILDGTYGPGFRLVIDVLARELGISAVPIREAIRRLEAEGWVLFQRNVGAQIMPLTAERWQATMEVLATLQGRATALSAPHLGPEEIARARELNEKMETALESLDPLVFGRLNREFHAVTYGHCPNPYLMGLLRQTLERLDVMRRSVFLYIPARGWTSLPEHRELVDAIEAQAGENEIERLARQHVENTIDAFLEHDRAQLETPVEG